MYFSKLPDLLYTTKITKAGSGDFVKVKNLFRRYKLSDNARRAALQFYKYLVPEGETPEQVANTIYDDPNLHWVIMIINDMSDIYEQWPLDQQSLEELVYSKYDNPDAVHHNETNRITDSEGNLVVREGLTVQPGWTYEYLYSQSPVVKRTLTFATDTYAVTNYDYEERLNDAKREIDLLKPQFLQAFIADFEEITSYEPNSDLEDLRTKRTAIDLVRKYY